MDTPAAFLAGLAEAQAAHKEARELLLSEKARLDNQNKNLRSQLLQAAHEKTQALNLCEAQQSKIQSDLVCYQILVLIIWTFAIINTYTQSRYRDYNVIVTSVAAAILTPIVLKNRFQWKRKDQGCCSFFFSLFCCGACTPPLSEEARHTNLLREIEDDDAELEISMGADGEAKQQELTPAIKKVLNGE
jgi:hypothetical protein